MQAKSKKHWRHSSWKMKLCTPGAMQGTEKASACLAKGYQPQIAPTLCHPAARGGKRNLRGILPPNVAGLSPAGDPGVLLGAPAFI
jgi:hypothetical protein